MHYADGVEAKMGDVVRSAPKDIPEGAFAPDQVIGVVVGGQPNADACNINVQILAKRRVTPLGVSGWIPTFVPYEQLCQSKELLLVSR